MKTENKHQTPEEQGKLVKQRYEELKEKHTGWADYTCRVEARKQLEDEGVVWDGVKVVTAK